MEPLNEREHEELHQAAKNLVYFADRRQLNDNEKSMIEWAKLMLSRSANQ